MMTSILHAETNDVLVDRFPNEQVKAYDGRDNSGLFFYRLRDYLSPKGRFYNKREIVKLVAYAQSSRISLTPQISFLDGRKVLFSKMGDLSDNETVIVQAVFYPRETSNNQITGDIYWYVTNRSDRLVSDSGKKKDIILNKNSQFGFSNADMRFNEFVCYPNNGYVEISYRLKK
jgi:hypothetical protein